MFNFPFRWTQESTLQNASFWEAHQQVLDQWLKSEKFNHISDYLGYLTLYTHGGIYLDLDVIVLKSLLLDMNNTLGFRKTDCVNHAVAVFDHGHKFLEETVAGFQNNT